MKAPRLDELLEPGARGGIVFDDQHTFLHDSWRVIDGHCHVAGSPYLHASPPQCHFYRPLQFERALLLLQAQP